MDTDGQWEFYTLCVINTKACTRGGEKGDTFDHGVPIRLCIIAHQITVHGVPHDLPCVDNIMRSRRVHGVCVLSGGGGG